jgi:5-methylcytosine-specific restriction endonuclease McrA
MSTRDRRRAIYDRTAGHCHLCSKALAFTNYGKLGERGAWEVDHSNPRVSGGSDRLNNLYPACISCNRSKGSQATRAVRAGYGRTRAPLSNAKRSENRFWNALEGGGAMTLVLIVLGAPFSWVPVLAGGALGYLADPE